ncbi:hypothetical protein Golomagni_06869, partial [Golovinomyces magnicellulatus]
PTPRPEPPYTLTSGPFKGLELPFSSPSANAGHVTRSLVDTYLITHPHLDHISAFVINTAGLPGARPKKLAALPSTIQAFKTHIFNNIIWPNLSDENNGAGLLTYMRLVEGGSPALGEGEGKGYMEVCDGLLVKTWSVSHGHCIEKHSHRGSSASSASPRFGSHDGSSQTPRRDMHSYPALQGTPKAHSLISQNSFNSGSPVIAAEQDRICVYDSSAYFIQDQTSRREVLIFGDVEPDSISLSPRHLMIWQEAAPKIASGSLAAIFIECSYDDSQSNDRLFGHLKPTFIIEEMKALAGEVEIARKIRSIENKKRKRTSVDEGPDPRRNPSIKSESMDDPISPKSIRPSMRPGDLIPKVQDPDTPHLATPTAEMSLQDLEAATLPPPVSSIVTQPLAGLKVVIIHVKEKLMDGPNPGDTILEQLLEYEQSAQLGCEFIISKNGQSFYF